MPSKSKSLMPGSQRAIKSEKAWRELEALGIVSQVEPQEPTNWTSAVHIVPKPDGGMRPCGDFSSPGQNEMHSLLVLVTICSRDACSASPPVNCVCAPLTCSFYKKEREKGKRNKAFCVL